jgi:hypothetical protein
MVDMDFKFLGGMKNMDLQIIGLKTNASAVSTGKTDSKPTWNSSKVYKYLEDYNDAAVAYGNQMAQYYRTQTNSDGKLTVDELKKQIGEIFSQYTLTSSEPSDVVKGKNYLYIDDSQLNKMANDAEYRAKVYGLMDREYTCSASYTLQYSDGKNVTAHCTGSIFSLSEKNSEYAGADGIPYRGSCSTDQPWSSSESHCQVKSASFINDVMNPKKNSSKKTTSATKNTAKSIAEKLKKKRAEKKAEKEKAEKKIAEEKLEEKLLEKRTENSESNKDNGTAEDFRTNSIDIRV